MATIRKRGHRFQVQIRRKGQSSLSLSFIHRKDAEQRAREMEIEADRHRLKTNLRILDELTLGDLVKRYRDTISPRKKSRDIETIVWSWSSPGFVNSYGLADSSSSMMLLS